MEEANGDNKEEEEEEDARDWEVVWFISAWVIRPEPPKGVKEEVKDARSAKTRPKGTPTRNRGPTGS